MTGIFASAIAVAIILNFIFLPTVIYFLLMEYGAVIISGIYIFLIKRERRLAKYRVSSSSDANSAKFDKECQDCSSISTESPTPSKHFSCYSSLADTTSPAAHENDKMPPAYDPDTEMPLSQLDASAALNFLNVDSQVASQHPLSANSVNHTQNFGFYCENSNKKMKF